jgi:hypothetical protein
MKTVITYFLVAGLFASVLLACSSKEEGEKSEIKLEAADLSDCLNNKSATLDSDTIYEKIIIEAIGDNHYKMSHENTTFNCCLSEGVDVTVTCSADTIFFSEKEAVPGICDCICRYNLDVEVSGVADGSYVLYMEKEGVSYFAVQVEMDKNTYIEKIISEQINNQ